MLPWGFSTTPAYFLGFRLICLSMPMNFHTEAPPILREFLTYHETIQSHSKKTVDEYYLDLRNFFRYIKLLKGHVPAETALDQITIDDVDLSFVKAISLSDVYAYMNYLNRERPKRRNSADSGVGLAPAARARKVAAIR